MSSFINHLKNSQATQDQGPTVKNPVRSQSNDFASLMQSLSKDKKKPETNTSKPLPPPGSTEDRIYKAVHAASEKYNLPPALIFGVIKQESGFKPSARSWCGAQGLMQLMPGTAKQLGVKDAYNIEQNIDGGSKYLRQMLNMFDGDLKKAVAAYNAGPGNVKKHGGIPPFEETQKYVPAVLAHAEKFNSGAPIHVPADRPVQKSTETAVAAQSPQNPPIDYDLVVKVMDSSEMMTQAALSLSVVSNVQPLEMPKSSKSNDEPPPPPPPGMRV